MLGGIVASIVLVAALFGMLKFKSESFDKSMMYGLSFSVVMMWIIPWGIFIIGPLVLTLSVISPAARREEKPAAKPSIPSNQFIALVRDTNHIAAKQLLTKGGSIIFTFPKNGK